jgi:hypothetical protein
MEAIDCETNWIDGFAIIELKGCKHHLYFNCSVVWQIYVPALISLNSKGSHKFSHHVDEEARNLEAREVLWVWYI